MVPRGRRISVAIVMSRLSLRRDSVSPLVGGGAARHDSGTITDPATRDRPRSAPRDRPDRPKRPVGQEMAPRGSTVGKGRLGMPPVALVDPATIDTSRVLADREAIRRGNP